MSDHHTYKKIELVGSSPQQHRRGHQQCASRGWQEYSAPGVVRGGGHPWAYQGQQGRALSSDAQGGLSDCQQLMRPDATVLA